MKKVVWAPGIVPLLSSVAVFGVGATDHAIYLLLVAWFIFWATNL